MKITAVPEMGREGPVTRAMSLTPAPSSTPTAFHPFKKMPVELRNKVWKLAIPEHGPRVLNLIIQQEGKDGESFHLGPRRSTPAIGHVSFEARAVAQTDGQYVFAKGNNAGHWFDVNRDILVVSLRSDQTYSRLSMDHVHLRDLTTVDSHIIASSQPTLAASFDQIQHIGIPWHNFVDYRDALKLPNLLLLNRGALFIWIGLLFRNNDKTIHYIIPSVRLGSALSSNWVAHLEPCGYEFLGAVVDGLKEEDVVPFFQSRGSHVATWATVRKDLEALMGNERVTSALLKLLKQDCTSTAMATPKLVGTTIRRVGTAAQLETHGPTYSSP